MGESELREKFEIKSNKSNMSNKSNKSNQISQIEESDRLKDKWNDARGDR